MLVGVNVLVGVGLLVGVGEFVGEAVLVGVSVGTTATPHWTDASVRSVGMNVRQGRGRQCRRIRRCRLRPVTRCSSLSRPGVLTGRTQA